MDQVSKAERDFKNRTGGTDIIDVNCLFFIVFLLSTETVFVNLVLRLLVVTEVADKLFSNFLIFMVIFYLLISGKIKKKRISEKVRLLKIFLTEIDRTW